MGGITAEYGVFLQFGAGGGCIGVRVEDGDVVGTGGQQFFQPRILFGQPFFFGFPCGLFLARGSFFRQRRGWPVFGYWPRVASRRVAGPNLELNFFETPYRKEPQDEEFHSPGGRGG